MIIPGEQNRQISTGRECPQCGSAQVGTLDRWREQEKYPSVGSHRRCHQCLCEWDGASIIKDGNRMQERTT